MRTALPVAALIAVVLGCGSMTPSQIQGTWVEPHTVPGASFTLTLSERAGSVSGTGAYTIEAGPSGTIVVTGGYSAPNVTLTFNYSDGRSATYTATIDSGRMTGTEKFGDGTTVNLVLNRQ